MLQQECRSQGNKRRKEREEKARTGSHGNTSQRRVKDKEARKKDNPPSGMEMTDKDSKAKRRHDMEFDVQKIDTEMRLEKK